MSEKLGRVLCVDDEPNILRALQWLLQKDFEVTTASSGQDALPIVKCNDFDVIISDQRMPGMTGSEFLREVRGLSPRSMRILLTGYSDMQAILRSVNESEVFRFIHKPWDVNELPKVVAQAAEIARRHSGDPALPEAQADAAPTPSSESVLVIDDDPAVAQLLAQALGATRPIVHAHNVAEALHAIRGDRDDRVGIILADTHVGGMDTTALLKVLKREHPNIVSVVYTAAADAVDVVTLINCGQIFRFLPKPVKPITLRLAMTAATLKRQRMMADPYLAARHRVDGGPATLRDLQLSGADISAPPGLAGPDAAIHGSLLHRLGDSFRRLVGAG